jgi:Holliday junction DNA helicase RuvA
MICRICGRLESLDGMAAVVNLGAVSHEVLVPMYLSERLEGRVGQEVTLTTLEYLEAQGQGSSFIPRLIGFEAAKDREFFLLFTTVKGIGNKKALRAMAVAPAAIASAIAAKDSKALAKLPEVGKRLSETIVAELTGRVAPYLGLDDLAVEFKPTAAVTPVEADAVEALIALGENRANAEAVVAKAMASLAAAGVEPKSSDEVIARVYAARA